MSTPDASKVYVASARLADKLVKLGVPILEQGVVVNNTRCFVFEKRPEYMRALKKVLGNAIS